VSKPTDIDVEVAVDLLYGPLVVRVLTGHLPLTAALADDVLSRARRVGVSTLPPCDVTHPLMPCRVGETTPTSPARRTPLSATMAGCGRRCEAR
jgi:hypothetical protein